MRKLVVLGLLAVLLLVVDQGARLVVEDRLEARARQAATDEDAAHAGITSFPFLGRLLLSGSVPRVRVRVDRPRAGPLRLAAVVVEAFGVEVDRGGLASGRVRLEDIDRGSVSVEIDGAALADTLGLPVTVDGGEVLVGLEGISVPARLDVGDGALVLRVAGARALRVPVVRTPLIPCAVTSVAVEGDRVRLSCEVDELPPALRR